MEQKTKQKFECIKNSTQLIPEPEHTNFTMEGHAHALGTVLWLKQRNKI